MITPVKVIVIGCTPLAEKILAAIADLPEVLLRGAVNLHPRLGVEKSNYCPLSQFARARPENLYYTQDVNDEETLTWIRQREPDVIIQAGWSQIFKKSLLELPRLFCIGVHPAPLPLGRGAAIINWKLIEGGGPWGNSLFVMEEKTDNGDILDFEPFNLEPRDDARTAYLKVDRSGCRMIVRTLKRIAQGEISRTNQQDKPSSRYYKRRPEDGKMQFDWPAEKILNYVRALTHPYPGAYFALAAGKLLVWRAQRGPDGDTLAPGSILAMEPGRGVQIQVGEQQSIWITEITPPQDWEGWSDIWAAEKGLRRGFLLSSYSS